MSKSKYNINFADTKSNIKETCDIVSPRHLHERSKSRNQNSPSIDLKHSKQNTSDTKRKFPLIGKDAKSTDISNRKLSENTRSVNDDTTIKNSKFISKKSYSVLHKNFGSINKNNANTTSLTKDFNPFHMSQISKKKPNNEMHKEYLTSFKITKGNANARKLKRVLQNQSLDIKTEQRIHAFSEKENSKSFIKNVKHQNPTLKAKLEINALEDNMFFMDTNSYLSNIKRIDNKDASLENKFASIERFYATNTKQHEKFITPNKTTIIKSNFDLNKYTPKNYISGINSGELRNKNNRTRQSGNITSNMDDYYFKIYQKDISQKNLKREDQQKRLPMSTSCIAFKPK